MSKEKLLATAAQIEKLIESGKITGKAALKKARYKMYNCRYRANKASKASPKVKAEPKAKRGVKAKFDANQGFLPNFLKQMDLVRVEELVAQKVFDAIKTGSMSISASDKKKSA